MPWHFHWHDTTSLATPTEPCNPVAQWAIGLATTGLRKPAYNSTLWVIYTLIPVLILIQNPVELNKLFYNLVPRRLTIYQNFHMKYFLYALLAVFIPIITSVLFVSLVNNLWMNAYHSLYTRFLFQIYNQQQFLRYSAIPPLTICSSCVVFEETQTQLTPIFSLQMLCR